MGPLDDSDVNHVIHAKGASTGSLLVGHRGSQFNCTFVDRED
jgi:hypothetical protein